MEIEEKILDFKNRYIAISDISNGKEVDDIQSFIRLLLYSDEIELEGFIISSSCYFYTKEKIDESFALVKKIINNYYKKDYKYLKIHSSYPNSEYLLNIIKKGIPYYYKRKDLNKYFTIKENLDNEGVKLIISSILKEDKRKLYFGIWGGSAPLAVALYILEKRLSKEDFINKVIKKIVIYGISDQDFTSLWIRNHFKGKIKYIVSFSKGDGWGGRDYYKATWPGISADNFVHGSEDRKRRSKGFKGANTYLISNEFIKKEINNKGNLGSIYPLSTFILEGDSPSLLYIINNGLNYPSFIEYGGWGGRYIYKKIKKHKLFKNNYDLYPLYTDTLDRVIGNDNKEHISPQASIWRFREAFQNDFLGKLNYLISPTFKGCSHPLKVYFIDKNNNILINKDNFLDIPLIKVKKGENKKIRFEVIDIDKKGYILKLYPYYEVSDYKDNIDLSISLENKEIVIKTKKNNQTGKIHLILEAKNNFKVYFVRYARLIIDLY